MLATAAVCAPAALATTERASVSSGQAQAKGSSGQPAVSADGRFVAFVSHATNLVPGDVNGQEVFIRDLRDGSTERVAVNQAGSQATRASNHPAVSADGRFVAFESIAANLISGDTNGREDVFVKDRLTGAVDRVSVTSTGKQALASSGRPAISADGRFVAFESSASLVPDDTNRYGDAGSVGDVFVHDRVTHVTERVSVDSTGGEVADGSGSPSISADGRLVGFVAPVAGLVAGDTNGLQDAFVHDRDTGATERVSVDSTGRQTDSWSGPPQMPTEGSLVAFTSNASNLVPNDANGAPDIFLRDQRGGRTTRASLDAGGGEANGANELATISADGRVVAFTSSASDLVAGDGNGLDDVFIRELASGRTRRVSVGNTADEANGPSGRWFDGLSGRGILSADGSMTAFDSEASNLVLGDTNGYVDAFTRRELFKPATVTAPRISGTSAQGSTLAGSRGVWAGTPTIAFVYQWQRCDGLGQNCRSIAEAHQADYSVGAGDVGHRLRFRVRATNDAGPAWRSSAATKAITVP